MPEIPPINRRGITAPATLDDLERYNEMYEGAGNVIETLLRECVRLRARVKELEDWHEREMEHGRA